MNNWEGVPSFKEPAEREEYERALDLVYDSIFEKIEGQMTSLVLQLKENIDSGKYDTIISDELTGRIVALVIKKVMSKVFVDGTSPDILFVAGGSNLNEVGNERVKDAIGKKVKDSQGVLVATDFIAHGKTAKCFLGFIKQARKDLFDSGKVDIATHGSYASGLSNLQKDYPEIKVFNGGSYDTSNSLGVGKTGLEFSGKSPYPEKTNQPGTEFTNEERTAKIRARVEKLAEKIYQKIWKQNEETTN